MNQAQYREQSYLECPQRSWKFDKVDDPLYYTEMAEAGFFFSPTSRLPDRVICFFCHRNFSSWKQDSDPFLIHLQKSPTCSWALCKSITKISAEKSRQVGLILPDILSETLTKARTETFDLWPHASKKGWSCTIPKLVQSGFYFAPIQQGADAVTCVACESTLLDWASSDDPLKSHFGLNPECNYLLLAEKHGYPDCLDQNDTQTKPVKISKSKKTKKEQSSRSDISSFTDTSINSLSSDCSTTGHRRSTRIQKNQEKALQEKLERRRRRKIKKDLAARLITQEEADALYNASNIYDCSATTSNFSITNTSLAFDYQSKTPETAHDLSNSNNILPETPASVRKNLKVTTPIKPPSSNLHATQSMSPKKDISIKKYPQRITYSRRAKFTTRNDLIESTSEENSFNDSEIDSVFSSHVRSSSPTSPSNSGYSSNTSEVYQDKTSRKSKRNLNKKSTSKLKKDSKRGKSTLSNSETHGDTIFEISSNDSLSPENDAFSTIDKPEISQVHTDNDTVYKESRSKISKKTDSVYMKKQTFNSQVAEPKNVSKSKMANLTFPKFNYSPVLPSNSSPGSQHKNKPAMEKENTSSVQNNPINRKEIQKAPVLLPPTEESNSVDNSSSHKIEETDESSTSQITNTAIRRSKRIPVIAERREQERLAQKRKRREARLLKAQEKESKTSHTSSFTKNQLKKFPSITTATSDSQSTSLNTSYIATANSSGLIAETLEVTPKFQASPKQQPIPNSIMNQDNNINHIERSINQSVPYTRIRSSLEPEPESASLSTKFETDHPETSLDKSPVSTQVPTIDKIDQGSSPLVISTTSKIPEVEYELNNVHTIDEPVCSPSNDSSPRCLSVSLETNKISFVQTSTDFNELPQLNESITQKLQSHPIDDSFKKVSFLALSDLERSLTLEELIHKLAKDQVSHLEANALARCQALDDLLTKAKDW